MGKDRQQPGGEVLCRDESWAEGSGTGNAAVAANGRIYGQAADGGTMMRALLTRTIAKIRNLRRSQSSDAELEREIALHVAMLEEEYERRGMSPEGAHRAARQALGGVEQAKQAHRDQRGIP